MAIQKIKTGCIEDDSITTSKVLDGSVTPEKLATSGTLPAFDGSQLTGIQSGSTEIIDDTVDPAIDTNPADGVGTLWANTTTGCLFCCTDATTDNNIWTRITVCTDIIGVESSSPFRGNSWGFAGNLGGVQNGSLIYYNLSSGVHQIISTVTGVNGAPNGGWGTLNPNTIGSTDSCSSTTQAYIFGCHLGAGSSFGIRDILERFTFASATSVADHDSIFTHFPVGGSERTADFFSAGSGGVSSIATNRGYIAGGGNHENGFNLGNVRSIQLDSGVVDANVTTLPSPFTQAHVGLANSTQALFCGGNLRPSGENISRVVRFVFSSETITDNFGDISDGVLNSGTATSTETDGFIVSGTGTENGTTIRKIGIQKISHSSGGASIDHGELDTASAAGGRHQTDTHGFQVGGVDGNSQNLSSIQRYAYANNVTAQEVSNLAIVISEQTSCYPVF